MTPTIINANCLDALRDMPDNSVDAICTDPPYGLSNTTPDKVADTIVRWASGDREYTPSTPRKGRKNCLTDILRRAQGDADRLDASSSEKRVNLKVALDVASFTPMFRAVDLNDDSTLGQVEVDDVSPVLALDDVLVNGLFANFSEKHKDVDFRLRAGQGGPCCVGECACFAELAHSRVSVGVRLGYYSLANTEGAAPVVALTTTEVRAVLTFDVRRAAFELTPASAAVEHYPVTLVAGAKLVGTGAGAGGLAPVLKSAGVGEVDGGAYGANTLDFVVHGDLLERFSRPNNTPVGFMGQEWDGFVPAVAVWDECYRVLKPGGHMAVFAGSRTQDLMGIAIRFAGFEIRDSLAWIAGSGFPKSLNVGKATGDPKWDGFGTSLKPAIEPILLARKPLVGTVAANVTEWGTGAINIDACRIGMSQEDADFIRKTARPNTAGHQHIGGVMNRPSTPTVNVHAQGRFPANVVLDEHAAHELDQQSGNRPGFKSQTDRQAVDKFGGTDYGTGLMLEAGERQGYNDEGGASRFFKVADPDPPFMYAAKAPKRERPNVDGVQHPTVKPLALMRWLVRLLTPPGGVVLDPFAGSGTTVEAALLEGFHPIGIEAHEPYIRLIEERVARNTPQGGLLDGLEESA